MMIRSAKVPKVCYTKIMSFRKNNLRSLDFDEIAIGPTKEEAELVSRTWAGEFRETIFDRINEAPYAALFSEKENSRPNVPVNVIISLLTLKELFGQTDEEAIASLLFDSRYKFALRTAELKNQITNVSVLTRFRKKAVKHLEETGTDLIKNTFKELEKEIEKLMGITGTKKRIDSMMIAANIKRLGRLELLYECVSDAVREIEKRGGKIPEELRHYTEKSDRNKEFYHKKDGESYEERAERLIKECEAAKKIIEEKEETKESAAAKNLERVILEQTVEEDGKRRLKKENEGMGSEILQNPADPDATYRKKAGKEHRGYVANIEESVGENGSLVSDYDVKKNTYSDKQFLKDSLEKSERQDEPRTIVADGAYASEENRKLAEEKNISLVTTSLTGKETEDVCADFELGENDREVARCPLGHVPEKCSFSEKTGEITAYFGSEKCALCPFRDKCHAKIGKKNARVRISRAKKERAISQRFMKSNQGLEMYKFRNGVESLPSQYRRAFHADKIPQRGLSHLLISYGIKTMGLNFKKYMAYKRNTSKKEAESRAA